VIYSMSVSLDGFVADSGRKIELSAPDAELLRRYAPPISATAASAKRAIDFPTTIRSQPNRRAVA
jgi:hypothetical protein